MYIAYNMRIYNAHIRTSSSVNQHLQCFTNVANQCVHVLAKCFSKTSVKSCYLGSRRINFKTLNFKIYDSTKRVIFGAFPEKINNRVYLFLRRVLGSWGWKNLFTTENIPASPQRKWSQAAEISSMKKILHRKRWKFWGHVSHVSSFFLLKEWMTFLVGNFLIIRNWRHVLTF